MRRIHVLVRNGLIQAGEKVPGPKEWLDSAPRGAYTTARTVSKHSVFEFESHINRLLESASLMQVEEESDCTQIPKPSQKFESLRSQVVDSVNKAVKEFNLRNPDIDGEKKITLLLTTEGNNRELFCHVTELPERPESPVKAGILGAPRTNATAKDSEWVRQRKHLEEKMKADTNELVLVSPNGELMEGLSSNFFAIQDGAVHTAGDGILKGTVRQVILDVCKENQVPIVFTPPNVATIMNWEAAFISSTSRLLLPLDEIHVLNEDDLQIKESKTFENSKDSLIRKLEELVQRNVLNHSSKIIQT
mmetsp:Transcript_12386/g.14220  ORF Transcript_12386/g.14220 Transcript_12386/m.14220 type:complete len:305 (-) Transcript_12386:532-1446(-)|eukprot:CAMPEP_0184005632 /NCGR_PEP_ID=MMETSP0954-20121128/178_2 /TAXON_ID=627963 /ORGANISM="Aplanochytrium sp, Strain PBS07" /LENGTH=304 /DNA_ID=CAMNT_0026283957 /DNA_START=488 /DNA_END=1402 /DNA_ORIENTATION=-